MSHRPARRGALRIAAAFMALGVGCATVHADGADKYPDRPVKLVMPFPAGGTGDVVARQLAAALSKEWGQPVVVDNRAGASGMIGNEYVARAAPDGYTLLMAISQVAIAPAIYPKIAYDIQKDFTPLLRLADATLAFITNDPQIRSFKDYITLAAAAPDKYSYGTYGAGTSAHIFAEMLNREAGIRTVHVPYKGAAPLMADLLAGHVTLSFSDLAAALPFVQAGKVRAYAVTGPRRAPLLPDVPTLGELGYKGFDATGWYGAFAPAHTPPDIARKIGDALDRAVRAPEMQARLVQMGLTPPTGPTEDLALRLANDLAYWQRAVTQNHIRIEQ